MPPRGDAPVKRPPAEPLGHLKYGITFDSMLRIFMPYSPKQPEIKGMWGKFVMP